MLRNETEQRQNQIVGRIFSAISMKFPEDDEATDELLAEWREELAEFSLDEIGKRVKHWKEQDRTPPADEFALDVPRETPPGQKPDKMSTEEIMDKAGKLYKVFCTLGEPDTTFEQAYNALELNRRWGPLEGRK